MNFLIFFTFSQEFWSPNSPIQNTIILLIEKIVGGMGDELKVYIPRLVHPVLKLFLQDTSEQKLATQKVIILEWVFSCGVSVHIERQIVFVPWIGS